MELKIFEQGGRVVIESAHGHQTKFPENMTIPQVKLKMYDIGLKSSVTIKLVSDFSEDFKGMFRGCVAEAGGSR